MAIHALFPTLIYRESIAGPDQAPAQPGPGRRMPVARRLGCGRPDAGRPGTISAATRPMARSIACTSSLRCSAACAGASTRTPRPSPARCTTISPAASLAMTDCWANVMPAGVVHSLHLHPTSFISGTYYVEVPKGAGALKFEDPRLGLHMATPPRRADAPRSFHSFVSLPARAGDLVLFESWLRHEVPPARFSGERISISFNYGWAAKARAADGTSHARSSCLRQSARRGRHGLGRPGAADLRRPHALQPRCLGGRAAQAGGRHPEEGGRQARHGVELEQRGHQDAAGRSTLGDRARAPALPLARRAVDLGQGPDDHRLPRGDAGQAQVRRDRRVPHLRRRCRPAQHAQGGRARQEVRAATCIRIPTPMPSRAISSRIPPPACCGRIRASSGRRRCARCCAAIRPCGAISPS